MRNKQVAVGFITCGASTERYLPEFLKSLQEQSCQDFEVLVMDNSLSADRGNVDGVRKFWPAAEVERAEQNLGFGKAANRLMNKAEAAGFDYFFLVNPDTFLHADAIKKLKFFMDERRDIATASPKILHWDFASRVKTDMIDSCGLALKPGFKFIDIGQGEKDRGQYDSAAILGPSGAGAFFRLADLAGLRFDENFFMYKEDCDLAYRLFLDGKKSALVSEAVIYHDRSVVKGRRRDKSQQAKRWAFYGQHLLLKKYWHQQSFWSKLMIIAREIGLLSYVLVFERYLLKEFKKF